MTKDYFKIEALRLIDTFGERFFPEPKLARIWGYVRDLDELQFKKIVDTFVDTMRSAPLPNHFCEAARPFTRYKSEAPMLSDECPTCDEAGWLSFPQAGQRLVVVACYCNKGYQCHRGQPGIPQILKGNESAFGKLDPTDFMPDDEETSVFDNSRVTWWKEVLKRSQEYWKQNNLEGESDEYWKR